jgi:hypothetical protein
MPGAEPGGTNEAARDHHASRRCRCRLAAHRTCAAARSNAADWRADGICGERSGRAIRGRGVPGCAGAPRMDQGRQSTDRNSLERRRWGARERIRKGTGRSATGRDSCSKHASDRCRYRRDTDDSHRVCERGRSDHQRVRREPGTPGRQCYRVREQQFRAGR